MGDCCGGERKDKDTEHTENCVDTPACKEENDTAVKNEQKAYTDSAQKQSRKTLVMLVAIVAVVSVSALILFSMFTSGRTNNGSALLQTPPLYGSNSIDFQALVQTVYPASGFVLPIKWGNSVKILLESGALNMTALVSAIEASKQNVTPYETEIMNGVFNGYINVNSSDSAFLLYVLWSLGVNNNNYIINDGPISKFGNPDQYASTGGYLPLGRLQLGALYILNLTASQEQEAIDVSEKTFRPCCNNPAMFPDCNHGAAELALIEMMSAQGYNESTIFQVLRNFLSMYYPQNMFDEAVVFASQGINFSSVPANTTVSYSLFSAAGAQNVGNYIQKYGLIPSRSASSGGSSCSA